MPVDQPEVQKNERGQKFRKGQAAVIDRLEEILTESGRKSPSAALHDKIVFVHGLLDTERDPDDQDYTVDTAKMLFREYERETRV